MNLVFTTLILALFVFSCTSNKPENKVAQALDQELSTDEIKKQMDIGLTNLLGKEETIFRKSVYNFFMDNLKISYSDIKVNGSKATVKVTAQKPNDEELSGFFFIASMVDSKKLNKMTMDQFLEQLSKDKRKTASVKDFPIDIYESTVDLNKDGEVWKVDPKSVKTLYSNKNKVKK